MARETHPPPSDPERPSQAGPTSKAVPGALFGLGKTRVVRLHGDPTRGAELVAPTAPHATAPTTRPTKLSGPARFWDPQRIRRAATLTFVLSVVAHWFVAPWNLLPSSSGIELKDPAGELAIPVDLLGEEPPPPPPPEPAPAPPPPPESPSDALLKLKQDREKARNKPDASAPRVVDGGQDLAMLDDASAPREGHDGGAPTDAGESDAALVAMADAGAGTEGAAGPRDPESMFGLTKVVNAGVQNVVLGVNVAVIRKHPVGARMGPLLREIPQWKDFLKGTGSLVDPIRDSDWILIYGPSLIHTDRDAVLVRYNVSDSAVDATVAAIARTYDKGGPFDAGVPGVKASLGHADNAQRVFLRPQSKLLVIVPPSHAREAALTFRKQSPRGPSPREAMRLVVHNPTNQISIRGLKFSESLTEIRLWIVPHDDGSAIVYAEGDCTDGAAAEDSAEKLNDVLQRTNSLGVKFATRGLLNKATVVADGSKVKLELTASPEQLEAVLQLAGAALNAQIAPPPSAFPPPSPPSPQHE